MPLVERRKFILTLATVPAAVAPLAAQQPAGRGRRGGGPGGAGGRGLTPQPDPLKYGAADDVAEYTPAFFTPEQFAALDRLGTLLMPPMGGNPGARDCHAAEFLDFLLGQSPRDRQVVYQAGLDGLNGQAKKRFRKPFAEVEAAEAEDLLAPLKRTWSYAPADPVEKFLRVAHDDLRTATQNSREWAVATGSPRTQLWLRPLD
jgi:hypothetical protein